MSDQPDDDQDQEGGVKRTKHRSPNYPLFGLQKAVERAQQLHEKYKRSLVPINLVQELWGYRQHGGSGNQAVAALKAYGLLDVEGDGKSRRVRLTDAAFRILMGSPDRAELLKKAAVGPPLHSELWEKYRAEEFFPDDELIEHYLLWDRPGGTFNADSVGGFIENFRGSLRYANLLPDGIVGGGLAGEGKRTGSIDDRSPAPPVVKLGDLVQWTCNGQDMYAEPRRVQGLYNDEYAYVEGSPTGVLISELTIMEPKPAPQEAAKVTPKGPPPANPNYRPTPPSAGLEEPAPKPGMWEARTKLDEGSIIVQLPDKLSAASCHDLEYFLNGIVYRARRNAGLSGAGIVREMTMQEFAGNPDAVGNLDRRGKIIGADMPDKL